LSKKLNFKFMLLIFIAIFGIAFSIPSFFNTSYGKKINLGLDLKGGLYLLLDVDTDKVISKSLTSNLMSIKRFAKKKDILIKDIKINKNTNDIVINLLDSDDIPVLRKKLDNNKNITYFINKLNVKISLLDKYIKDSKKEAYIKTIDVIRNRLNQYGLSEPTVTKKGSNQILIELAGISTPEQENQARELITKTANLEISEVIEKKLDNSELDRFGYKKVVGDNPEYNLIVSEAPIITGAMIKNATVGFDKNNKIAINYELNSDGADIFADYTGSHIGKRTAIILDNKLLSAPSIASRIGGGAVQITGQFTFDEANSIVIALKSGSLSADVKVIEKRMIGPNLGKESIKTSLIALVFGFMSVFFFMIVYYRVSGLIAATVLLINLIVLIAIMSLMNATLTLPGMAGIVLTVGMAVDANVIILERIKEFLKEGFTIKQAIEKGYDKAMTSILDANITTVIAAILLYVYGTGTIKGFAITMVIGILTSMITGIYGTKGIYDFMDVNKYNKKNLFNLKGDK